MSRRISRRTYNAFDVRIRRREDVEGIEK